MLTAAEQCPCLKEIRLEHDGGKLLQIYFSVAGSIRFPDHVRQLGIAEGQTSLPRRSSKTIESDASCVVVVEEREALKDLVENVFGVSLRIDDDLEELVEINACKRSGNL